MDSGVGGECHVFTALYPRREGEGQEDSWRAGPSLCGGAGGMDGMGGVDGVVCERWWSWRWWSWRPRSNIGSCSLKFNVMMASPVVISSPARMASSVTPIKLASWVASEIEVSLCHLIDLRGGPG